MTPDAIVYAVASVGLTLCALGFLGWLPDWIGIVIFILLFIGGGMGFG